MSRPPYFRPYGAQAFTRAVSASARTSVPRFWRMYLALWLIRRWRLPATPCLILPVAVSLKRFFTPLLVFSLGIFVLSAIPAFAGTGVIQPPRHAFWPGHWFSNDLESAALYWRDLKLTRRRVDGEERAGTEGRNHAAHHHPRQARRGSDRFLQAGIRRRGADAP